MKSYLIAGAHPAKADLTSVQGESEFARRIDELFARIRPRRIIETGTYLGTGTTATIASALQQVGLNDAVFFSIEVNPVHYRRAAANLERYGQAVRLLHGLSLPRALLPTLDQIEQAYVRTVEADQVYIDHPPQDRAIRYHRETDFPDLPDDLLGRCLDEFGGRPDFVLLDSAGHMGYAEFRYLIDRLRTPCYIALDDTRHIKHHRSLLQVRGDPRFEVWVDSPEKFGFCIARFVPHTAGGEVPMGRAEASARCA